MVMSPTKIPVSLVTHESLEAIGFAMENSTGTNLRKKWQAFTGDEAIITDLLLEATEGVMPLLPESGHYRTELEAWRTWAEYPVSMTHAVHRYGEDFGIQPESLDHYWAVEIRCRVLAMLYEWHILPEEPPCPQ